MSERSYHFMPFQPMASRKEKKGKKRNEIRKSDKTEHVLRQLDMLVERFGLRRVERIYGEVLRISISSYKHMDEISDVLTHFILRRDIEIISISFPVSGTVNNKRGFVIYMKTVDNQKTSHVLKGLSYHVNLVKTPLYDPTVNTESNPELAKLKISSLEDLALEIPLPARRGAPIVPLSPMSPTRRGVPVITKPKIIRNFEMTEIYARTLEPTSKKRWSDAVKSNSRKPQNKRASSKGIPKSGKNGQNAHRKQFGNKNQKNFKSQQPRKSNKPSGDASDCDTAFSNQVWTPPSPPKARNRFDEESAKLLPVKMYETKKHQRKSQPWRPSWKIARMQQEATFSPKVTKTKPSTPPGFSITPNAKNISDKSKRVQKEPSTSPGWTTIGKPRTMTSIVEDVKQPEMTKTSNNNSDTQRDALSKSGTESNSEHASENTDSTNGFSKGSNEISEHSDDSSNHDTDDIDRSRSMHDLSNTDNSDDSNSKNHFKEENEEIKKVPAKQNVHQNSISEPCDMSPNVDSRCIEIEHVSKNYFMVMSVLNILMGFVLLFAAYSHSSGAQVDYKIVFGMMICAMSCFMTFIMGETDFDIRDLYRFNLGN